MQDLDPKDLKACVKLVLPLRCDARNCEITEEAMTSLLEATQHKVPLLELQVVYDESGDFDQTALALEHLRWDSSSWGIGFTHFCFLFCFLSETFFLFTGFFLNTSGGSGMRKTRMMTLTTSCVAWSLGSDCERTLRV